MIEKYYRVSACRNNHGTPQMNYCDTEQEAEECAELMENCCEFVEIAYGSPGHWEVVSQSW